MFKKNGSINIVQLDPCELHIVIWSIPSPCSDKPAIIIMQLSPTQQFPSAPLHFFFYFSLLLTFAM